MAYAHHVLVHFPSALAILAAVAHVTGWFRDSSVFAELARPLTYLAAAGALLAAGAGLIAQGHVIEQGGDLGAIERHRNIALTATVMLLAAAAVCRAAVLTERRIWQLGGVFVASAGALLVGVAAHLGGDMLHPGLAPWSDEPHHHGSVGPDPVAPHAHGSPERHPGTGGVEAGKDSPPTADPTTVGEQPPPSSAPSASPPASRPSTPPHAPSPSAPPSAPPQQPPAGAHEGHGDH